MKVESIDSRLPFKFHSLRVHERVPEGTKFFACLGLTYWGPILLYCALTNQALPFYLMVCNAALGVSFGVLLYRKPPEEIPHCVPPSSIPFAVSAARDRERKKAA
jgi:hypothetical protein